MSSILPNDNIRRLIDNTSNFRNFSSTNIDKERLIRKENNKVNNLEQKTNSSVIVDDNFVPADNSLVYSEPNPTKNTKNENVDSNDVTLNLENFLVHFNSFLSKDTMKQGLENIFDNIINTDFIKNNNILENLDLQNTDQTNINDSDKINKNDTTVVTNNNSSFKNIDKPVFHANIDVLSHNKPPVEKQEISDNKNQKEQINNNKDSVTKDKKEEDKFSFHTKYDVFLKDHVSIEEIKDYVNKNHRGRINKNDDHDTKLTDDFPVDDSLSKCHNDQDLTSVQNYFLDKNSSFNTKDGYLPNFSFGDPNEISWKGLRSLNFSKDNLDYSKKLYERYESLKGTSSLVPGFMNDYQDVDLKVSHYLVPNETREKLFEKFKKLLPDLETRQMVSTYANQRILEPAYLKLTSFAPGLFRYPPKNISFSYEVEPTHHGFLRLIVTNKTKLHIVNSNNEDKDLTLGVRASVMLSKHRIPCIKFLYYLQK